MAVDLPSETFLFPTGVTSEDQDETFVKVNVVFLGLKKKLLKNEPSNGSIDLKFENSSIMLLLTMKGANKKIQKYKYQVRKLIDEVEPDNCYHQVKKNQVILFLKKASPRSWSRELSETGLDIYEDPEEL